MFKKLLIFIIIVAAGILVWQKTGVRDLVVKEIQGPQVRIGDTVFLVEIADSREEYFQGLSGRPGLTNKQGMYFIFGTPDLYGFWMKDMLFPIDIIWIRDNKVVGFEEEIEPDNSPSPRIYAPPSLVNRVLEVKAGMVRSRGIKVGDIVEFMES